MCSIHWLVASEHSDFLTPRHQLAAGHGWSPIAPFLYVPERSLRLHHPWSKRSTRACFEVQIEVVEATITKVKGVADDTGDEQEDGVAWRFGDQCLSCAGAKKVVGDRNARWWEIAEECTPC